MLSIAALAAFALMLVQAGSASAGHELATSKNCTSLVDQGEDFTCTITISVDDVALNSTITVDDNIPAGFKVEDVEVSGDGVDADCDFDLNDDSDVECDFGPFPLNEDVDITIVIELEAPDDDCGNYTNSAEIDLEDPAGATHDDDDTVSDSITVECDDDDNTITISKDTDPEDSSKEFDFDSSLGDFSLEDDESKTFTNVDDGTYTFTEDKESGWDLTDIHCSGTGHWVIDESDREVRITVDGDEHVSCEFNNEKDDNDVPSVQKPPVVIFIPLPAPQPAPQPQQQVVQQQAAPAPAPRPAAPAALPRTGDGSSQSGFDLALPAGISAALLVAGVGYAFARRQRDLS